MTDDELEEITGSDDRKLVYLKMLQRLDAISKAIARMELLFINSAIGRGQIPIESANLIFKVLGLVIIGLTSTIAFLLTGVKLGWLVLH